MHPYRQKTGLKISCDSPFKANLTYLFVVSSVKDQLKVRTESAANLFTLFKAADILFQEVQENASVIKSSLEPAGRKQSCSHTCCERIKYFSRVVRPRP
jgi:hypothetical protein